MTTTTAIMTIKSVTKQLYINRLNSPEDLQSLIKDFCFYDTKSWDTMQHIKSRKNRINHLLNKSSTISRANPEEFYYFGANEDEHWTFWVYDEEDGDDLQMQSVNCSKCGNYKMSSFNIPENIRCNCTNHNMTINDFDFDDDIDDDSDYIPEGFGIDPDFEYTSDNDSYDD